MRPLTDDETRKVFEKLALYIGRNVRFLVDRKDERFCFRLHRDRVFYLSERMMRLAASFPRKHLASAGTCFGKFTKSGKFHLKVTCLEYLAQYAKHKVWVKPSSEMTFLYGNHIIKAGVQRITEDMPQNAGVIVLSMSNAPLGFGLAAQAADRLKDLDGTAMAVLHQSDVGEYLREEEALQ
ncbi:hypothetical protein FNF27_00843 [Cafeteria roenbergensis]|uniref:60S ribosome subunit biogenesis protein NIP7 homolog n=1 Tax=Cafeteria roenbergensis TaxID=33653 RepID=A0A5A8DSM9_CAFRO|nr:hypothetical protein FNF29_01090 [Cafeteria roenbergensis]KAA0165654.1 hypothetical protein FNF28_03404 [Cafeteria roenbergensis]KAA0168403.1 hypothetical protein FNF31_00285 [Cafeteria roenbergensis]KAA0177670.1 hypothetical protein FNF27_00843 [Cafeteria roenbergensis]CAE7231832.1 nip7 [Symbiodinium sp. KB8]|eukprot:KAA0156297.1 hypothetical protein FNF29_01090 [Cafeteria roenbergensis]